MAQPKTRQAQPVKITIRPSVSLISYDRYIAQTEFRLSDQASKMVGDALTSIDELTIDDLARSMERAANAGLPDIAIELASTFSEIAKELMRGRLCTAEIA